MNLNVEKEVAALRRMTVNELRAKYADVFGEETKARHKEWLVRRIIWRIQALAEGDISERVPGNEPPNWRTMPTCERRRPRHRSWPGRGRIPVKRTRYESTPIAACPCPGKR